jgi:3D (Asp-Asp-Asp) domain-containing protein
MLWTSVEAVCAKISEETTVVTTTEVTEVTTEETTVEETTEVPLTTVKAEDIPDYTDLGVFKLTAYCPCSKCCGKSDGITASGKVAKPNHTVAADTSLLPLGTKLMIGGETYVVEDRGSAVRGMVIDIFYESHEEAMAHGVKYAKVFEVN